MKKLSDSGKRREFKTGAVRDGADGKGAFHLLPVMGVLAGALQMERGAKKYNARNWEKGLPLSTFVNSAIGHILRHMAGFDDEPHLDAAIWNLMCLKETQVRIAKGLLPTHLDDLPKTWSGFKWDDLLKELA